MKKYIINIKYYDPKYASMMLGADSLEELEAKKHQFLKINQSISWNSDSEKALASRESQDIDGTVLVEYAHSDMFYFEQIDNTEEIEKQELLASLQSEEDELLKLLADTDYLVIRLAETGVDYDQAIKDQRAEAREKISQIRLDIKALE